MSFAVEIGFIIFIISSYIYFLYGEQLKGILENSYKLGTAAITVGLIASGAYYLYKNPEQRGIVKEMLDQINHKKK
jgi:hypothetical protein